MKLFKSISLYLKDLRFSGLFTKYFILLFVVLILPVSIINVIYQSYQQKNLQERLIQNNEQSLNHVYSAADSAFSSSRNVIYRIAWQQDVNYLAIQDHVAKDNEKGNSLKDTFRIIKMSNEYLDSVGVWLPKSNMVVANSGLFPIEEYADLGWMDLNQHAASDKIVYGVRRQNGVYPYLLTYLYPIGNIGGYDLGTVFINIDLESLGKYLGTGRYLSKDDASKLFIFENSSGNLIYSDEYRFWQEDEDHLENIWQFLSEQKIPDSQIVSFWNADYIISALRTQEGFVYAYLSPNLRTSTIMIADAQYRMLFWIPVALCGIVALLFAIWIYRPIRKTKELLDNTFMLMGWDEKNGINEVESIQRSILHIKEHDDKRNELLKERMLSLNHAQICALQTQINPHFLYNCLESIGNMTAIVMGGENKVTEAIFTLGQLMRISLSGRNYLVPLAEELEHVNIYIHMMELIEPGFSDRIHLHMEIPEGMRSQRVIKLTLQPIIENALEHGFTGKHRRGNIWITGEIRENKNYLYVVDDGVGVNKEQLENLRESLKQSSILSNRHIGLRNVDQRLKLVFGDACGISVDQTDKFIVTVVFQSLKNESDN